MPNLLTALSALHTFSCHGEPDSEVTGITDHAPSVKPGDVFVAVAGTKFDGHSLVAHAIRQGAAAVVLQEGRYEADPAALPVPAVIVQDSRQALALLGSRLLPGVQAALDAMVWIGVTGTNGKTTVATLIDQLLSAHGLSTAFIGTTDIHYRSASGERRTLDTSYTTPHALALYNLALAFHREGITHVVMEVSSHALHQHRVAGIPYAAAIFTNLTRDHLDYHETMEQYTAAKKMLFDSLGQGALAVVNGHSAYAEYMLSNCHAERKLSVTVQDLTLSAEGATFSVPRSPFSALRSPFSVLRSPLLGEFNAINLALAATAAAELGVPPNEVVNIVTTIHPPVGRMERFTLRSGAVAVVDYAHTPDALENALRTLRPLTDHLTVVFGCGGDRDRGKRPQMGRMAYELADEVWLTSDNPRSEDPLSILADIQQGLPGEVNVHIEPDRAQAIHAALTVAGPGTVVLIAGKGHEQYQEVRGERLHFSDQEMVAPFA
jgi:UDP-N-acetylmuramyl-tripeptide synthetase